MDSELQARAVELANENAELRRKLQAAEGALENHDTLTTAAFNALKKEIDARWWLTEGRGDFQYDDDRYRDEFRYALEAMREIVNKAIPATNPAALAKREPERDTFMENLDKVQKDVASIWEDDGLGLDQPAQGKCECLTQSPEGCAVPNHGSLLLMVGGRIQNCCAECRQPFEHPVNKPAPGHKKGANHGA